jgi:dTMP kinase
MPLALIKARLPFWQAGFSEGEHILSLFVTFEGPEGCGKSTQIGLLAAYLRERGFAVLHTREPGSTPIGEQVRALLLDPARTEIQPATEFLLFSAARAQHVAQVIRPYLSRGGVVLCDRYADSSLAYQGYGHRLDLEVLRVITQFATGGLVPDLTFCLDLPVEVGLRRKVGESGDGWNRMEQKEIAYHERVRGGYLSMAAADPDRWVVVDATRHVDSVQAAIREVVMAHQGLKAKGQEGGIR